ncbi:hypothetical protein CEXT_184711 [Caerostris extrusa]|uniref:Uncharacterized protein n=1 Tax=Caerostris extrusa TaxID=172846 RepID=A0AAV4NJB4_CAEEX|nr:hypothetical protein CEXT_184711 [Caerostris extrusa]
MVGILTTVKISSGFGTRDWLVMGVKNSPAAVGSLRLSRDRTRALILGRDTDNCKYPGGFGTRDWLVMEREKNLPACRRIVTLLHVGTHVH